ncbi:unnamed protein product, partial [Allacma fusca]
MVRRPSSHKAKQIGHSVESLQPILVPSLWLWSCCVSYSIPLLLPSLHDNRNYEYDRLICL